ncbi:MAG: dihydrolipoyl dehydrogenase [Clostridia bacterium]
MKREIFDLIILGAGPAGYLAAERAGKAKLKTLLIEKRKLGGVCLNEGCVPSKAFLNTAKIYDHAVGSEKLGVTVKNARIHQKTVVEHKDKIVQLLTSGIKSKLLKNKVKIVMGEGKILPKEDNLFKISVESEEFFGKKFLLSTGSTVQIPPINGIETAFKNSFALTSREILDIDYIPQTLVVVGGGVVGLEMASYFCSAKARVFVVEMGDHIGGNIDSEVGEILKKSYEKKGVIFKLNAKVITIGEYFVEYEKEGEIFKIPCEKVLISIGRKPFIEGFGLENLSPIIENGCVKTDNKGQTSVVNLYAAGDVNGKLMLAHTAYRESEVVINNLLGIKDTMRYNAIPTVIYTNPEVASVGYTEQMARKEGIDVEVKKISMMYSGRYVAEDGDPNGIVKLVINKKYDTLIGVTMIGNYASEIIYGAGLMTEQEMRTKEIKELVFPHPTISEIIKEALFS